MEKELMDSLRDTIKKNMPAMVGEELIQLLETSKINEAMRFKLEEEVKGLRATNGSLSAENGKLQARIDEVSQREVLVAAREKDVNDKEYKLELTLLQKDLAGMTRERDTIHKLTETVFKNTVVRENVFGSATGQYMQPGSTYPCTTSLPYSHSVEKVSE